jgi:hypothetical protein
VPECLWLVLISDGNENLEHSSEKPSCRGRHIEVYTHPIGTTTEHGQSRGEVAIRTLEVPERLAEGEGFDLRVTIDATRDTDAKLRIYRNDSVVTDRDIHIAASGENVFVLPQRVEQKGFYSYGAEVEAIGADAFVQNNSREAFAIVEGQPNALSPGDERPSPGIVRVLAEGNFAADIRTPPAAATLAGFQNYDLVVFDNVPASALTTVQIEDGSIIRPATLAARFMMIGGDQSFGPGGYYKTPIQDALPVSLDVRQKKHLPSLALRFGNRQVRLNGSTKMQLTREASSATVDFLSIATRLE